MPILVSNYLWDSKSHGTQVPKNPNQSLWTPKSHGTRVPTCPKAWDLAVPEIFVPGLSQRYLSQSQASQKNQSQSRSQVPGFVSRDANPMGSQSPCPSLGYSVIRLLRDIIFKGLSIFRTSISMNIQLLSKKTSKIHKDLDGVTIYALRVLSKKLLQLKVFL